MACSQAFASLPCTQTLDPLYGCCKAPCSEKYALTSPLSVLLRENTVASSLSLRSLAGIPCSLQLLAVGLTAECGEKLEAPANLGCENHYY
eukprot:368383-Pelagomonas_calceolata.AAC.4